MRTLLFLVVAVPYLLIAVQALRKPDQVMETLGFRFDNINGFSEFHAVYVGIWTVTAGMLVYAGLVPEQQVLARFAALMVLAQPLGRLVGLFRRAMPVGKLRTMFALEAVGGVLLWLLA